jgi:GTPase SAR1 family protein
LPIVREEDPSLPVVLVGTKKDLINAAFDVVIPAVPVGLVERLGLQGFIDVSAKTGEHVAEAFDLILRAMLNSRCQST